VEAEQQLNAAFMPQSISAGAILNQLGSGLRGLRRRGFSLSAASASA
jgi:hypothetical protein